MRLSMRDWLARTAMLSTVLAAGCSGAGASDDAGHDSAPEDAFEVPLDGPDTGLLDDGQIVGVLHAIHRSEAQLAQLAMSHASRADVLAFAAESAREHTAADDMLTRVALAAGIVETPSALGRDITSAWMDETQALTEGTFSFDFSYVDFELGNHARALDTIQSFLIAAARSPGLRAELASASDMEMRHLADAHALFPDTGVPEGTDAGPIEDASFDAGADR
jgi:predicted outer membrane protein